FCGPLYRESGQPDAGRLQDVQILWHRPTVTIICKTGRAFHEGSTAGFFVVHKQKTRKHLYDVFALPSRSDGIRTHGLLVPNQARYQLRYTPIKKPQQQSCCGVVGDERIELQRAESESAALPLCESPSHF